MSIKNLTLTSLGATALFLAACQNEDGTSNNTATGALIGTAAGAATGLLLADDDNDRTAAVVGGVMGAMAGGAIGAKLDQQEAELRNQLGGSGALITNTGDRLIVTLPEAITFPVDGYSVKSSLMPSLGGLAQNLNDYPNTIVQVVGHTDNTGSDAYNQGLSERRAGAVADVLRQNGVSSSRIQTVGMGESTPIASNDSAAGRQQNRRVEINIIPTQGY